MYKEQTRGLYVKFTDLKPEYGLFYLVNRDSQDTCSDSDSLSSSLGKKQLSSSCTPGADTPQRKISRDELLLLTQEAQATALEATVSTPPPASSSTDLTSICKGSPDLTHSSALTESQSLTFHPAIKVAAYNGMLEKSYSLGQLPAGGMPPEGRYTSLSSLAMDGKTSKEAKQILSPSSTPDSDNPEKKRSKIKSLFKKSKKQWRKVDKNKWRH